LKFSNENFVHLHCHSTSSSFDSLLKIPDMVMTARKMGFPAIALTDHGNIQGVVQFLREAKKTKDKKGNEIPYPVIKPIVGSELYLARKMDIGQYGGKKEAEQIKKIQYDGRKGNRHINAYALNFEGFQNLCRLSQQSFVSGFYYDPRIDFQLLEKYSNGIMIGSACLSSIINTNLLYGRYDKAKRICTIFKEIFGQNFFLECMYHGIREEREIISDILKLSSQLDIPVCATNDCHYLTKDQAPSHDVLLAMSQRRCMKDEKRLSFGHNAEFYLKSAEEMGRIFGSIPHVLYNTVAIAERVNTDDIEKKLFGGMRLPKFDIPEEFKNSYEYVSHLSWEGMKKIGWDKSPKHVEALKKELADVLVAKENNDYDFSTYFLIVKDYIDYARENNILIGPGRGSGAGSVLLRTLGIINSIDPVNQGLIWERFLGFDQSRFIKPSDFGFKNNNIIDQKEIEDVKNSISGIERY
jgi:DNA polymerase III subunit alpha